MVQLEFPLVSVIIPTYNRADLLEKTLTSILEQTYDSIEIIVADDGSTDHTAEIVQRFGGAIQYLRLQHSGLPAVARNIGIAHAHGKYIAFCDSDDRWFPEKLAYQVSILERHTEVGLSCTNARVITDNQADEDRLYLKTGQGQTGHVLPALLRDNFIINSTAVIRTALLERTGMLSEDPRLRAVEDYDLWLRIAAIAEISYCAAPYIYYRDIPSSTISGELSASQRRLAHLCIFTHLAAFLKAEKCDNSRADKETQRMIRRYQGKYRRALRREGQYRQWVQAIFQLPRMTHDALATNTAKTATQTSDGDTPVTPHPALRLHLGCGETRLPGYVNIDFPPSEHTVQQTSQADVYADLTTLHYPSGAVDEVRLHHVFEHFDRVMALHLLLNWYTWLRDGGVLTIETPDIRRCAEAMLRETSFAAQQKLIRHMFGSHEASWAIHADGWDRIRFSEVLSRLGFLNISFQESAWQGIFNLTVRAEKASPSRDRAELLSTCDEILRFSLVDDSPIEQRMLQVWLDRLSELQRAAVVIPSGHKGGC